MTLFRNSHELVITCIVENAINVGPLKVCRLAFSPVKLFFYGPGSRGGYPAGRPRGRRVRTGCPIRYFFRIERKYSKPLFELRVKKKAQRFKGFERVLATTRKGH